VVLIQPGETEVTRTAFGPTSLDSALLYPRCHQNSLEYFENYPSAIRLPFGRNSVLNTHLRI
jgi:hypothetical protein